MKALRALVVTPLSGPLERFGRAGAIALSLWAERSPALPPGWGRVELDVVDAHPDPVAAMAAGQARHPHVVFGPYGSAPALAALGATTRLVWNHGAASSRLRRPRFPHAINIPAPAFRYLSGALAAVRTADPHARGAWMLHASTGFGREVARGAGMAAAELGFELARRSFQPGQAAEAARSAPNADVFLVAGSFEDELAAARILLDRPWRAAAFVGAGVDEVLASLGPRREGLLGPCQWISRAAREPEEGPDAAWFSSAYRDSAGHEPPYPAAAAFAAGLLCSRCLRDGGEVENEAMLSAAAGLSIRTLFGEFRIDPVTGLQTGHEVLTVQWQDGVRRVVWPPERAEAPIRK